MQEVHFVYQYSEDMGEVTVLAHFISEVMAYKFWFENHEKDIVKGWDGPVDPAKAPVGATMSYEELLKVI